MKYINNSQFLYLIINRSVTLHETDLTVPLGLNSTFKWKIILMHSNYKACSQHNSEKKSVEEIHFEEIKKSWISL